MYAFLWSGVYRTRNSIVYMRHRRYYYCRYRGRAPHYHQLLVKWKPRLNENISVRRGLKSSDEQCSSIVAVPLCSGVGCVRPLCTPPKSKSETAQGMSYCFHRIIPFWYTCYTQSLSRTQYVALLLTVASTASRDDLY